MVMKAKQHQWMFEKLVQWLTESGESVDPKKFTVRSVKNKVDNLRRKGKDLIHKHIKPIHNEEKNKRKQGTGSAADETAATPSDPMEAIDWEELEKIAKWPNFQLFWSLFGHRLPVNYFWQCNCPSYAPLRPTKKISLPNYRITIIAKLSDKFIAILPNF